MSDYMAAKMDDQISGAISENEGLRAENATLRAALAERQAAIDELVAVEEGNDLALGYTKRRFVAWATARALATKDKEPQPAAKEGT